MFWNGCCKNHSVKDEVVTNTQAFIDGCHTYGEPKVPNILIEGVCKRCGAVIRQERFWYPQDTHVISALMKEIRNLQKSKDNAEARVESSERLANGHYDEVVKLRCELKALRGELEALKKRKK